MEQISGQFSRFVIKRPARITLPFARGGIPSNSEPDSTQLQLDVDTSLLLQLFAIVFHPIDDSGATLHTVQPLFH